MLLIPVLYLASSWSAPPEQLTPQLIERLQQYLKDFPQEKVYVHTDRDHYGSGEVINMKFYQFQAHYDVPLSLSGVIHVDIIDSTNTVVVNGKFATIEGVGQGMLTIPQDLPSGAYRLRAYTQWMLNFDHGYLYYKDIFIGAVATDHQSAGPLSQLSVYVEGGTLVAGIRSRLVVTTKDQYGQPTATAGIIANHQGDTVTTFKTDQHGLGTFTLEALPGQSYQAYAQNHHQPFELPTVQDHGFAMNVTNAGANYIRVLIQCSNKYQGDSVVVTSMANGQIYFAARGLTSEQPLIINFPKQEIPHGVSTITVFDEDGIAQSQRSVYVEKDSPFTVTKSQGKDEYDLREEAEFVFKITDAQGVAVKANLSVAVVDATIPKRPTTKLRDYLALNSDLTQSQSVDWATTNTRIIDQLLVTQPFTRFNWRHVMDHTAPNTPLAMEESGITVSGSITNEEDQPAANQTILLSSPQLPQVFRWAVSDSLGNFEINNLSVQGKHQGYLKLNDTLGQQHTLKLASAQPLPRQWHRLNFITEHPYPKEKALVNELAKYRVAQMPDQAAQPNEAFYGKPDKTIVLQDFTKMPDMTEVFRELLPGVRLRDRDGYQEIRVIETLEDYLTGETLNRFQEEGPLLLVNNVPIFDPEFIVNLDPDVVTKIDILYGKRSIFGENIFQELEFSGIVAFTTSKPVIDEQQSYGLTAFNLHGFNTLLETAQSIDLPKRSPDLRDVLYWGPMINTDEDGNFKIKFNTSDVPSDFIIEIQGLSEDGQPIHHQHQFKTILSN